MELQIEGRHFKVTEAIKVHLEEKLGKLEKYFDGIHRMHVILDVEKHAQKQTVELVCTVAKRHTLVSNGEADDLYVAIDQAEKKMLTEMKKYKAKLHPVVRGTKSSQVLAGEEVQDPVDD
ncbi:MAG: ribosome-associated translation inhibitor RaiA [Planctomycetota bacterium]